MIKFFIKLRYFKNEFCQRISIHIYNEELILERYQCNQNRPIYDNRCSESRSSKMIGSPSGSEKVPNIMLLGKTGAGKSFFANGIIGEKDPTKGKIPILLYM